jgi:hypothetical protein
MKIISTLAVIVMVAATVAGQEYKPHTPAPITFYTSEAPTTGSIPNARYVTPQATYQTNRFGIPTSVEINPIYQHTHKVQLQPTRQGLPTYQVPQFQSPNSTYSSSVPQTTWKSNNSGIVTKVETQGVAQWQYQPVVVAPTGASSSNGIIVLPGILNPTP